VVLGLREDLVPTSADRLGRNALVATVDLHLASYLADPDLAAGRGPRHGGAVGAVGHVRIPADPAAHLWHIRVRRPAAQRLEMGLLGLPGFAYDVMGGPMHTGIGDTSHPGTQLTAQILQRAGLATGEEAAAEIADPRLHLAFRLSAIRSAQPRPEAPGACEVQEDGVPAHLAALVGTQHDGLGAIVEDLLRHAPQRLERRFVQPQEGLQPLVRGYVGIHRPRVSQGDHKPPDRLPALGRFQGAQMSPVHLGLLAWQGLKPAHRDRPGGLPLRMEVGLQDRVSPSVAALPQLSQQDDGIPDASAQTLVEVGLVRVEFAGPGSPGAVPRRPGLREPLADCLAVKAGEPRDVATRQALPAYSANILHVSTW